MKRTILRSAAVLGTVGFAGFLLAACSNSSSGSSEASKEINVYVDKGYKSYVEEAAKAFEKENGVKVKKFLRNPLQKIWKKFIMAWYANVFAKIA